MKRHLVATLLLLASCVAHERNGDQAAALGDWNAALREYRSALADNPESIALRQKHKHAKEEAAVSALKKAQACSVRQDWVCALREADFGLQLDDENVELATFRGQAAKSLAAVELQQVTVENSRHNYKNAFELLRKAVVTSPDPDTRASADALRGETVRAAAAQVDSLRAIRSYRDAITLLSLVAENDASQRPALDALRAEYDAILLAEYERLAQDGDAALGSHDWTTAQRQYQAAENTRPNGRAVGPLRYVTRIVAAERALAASDYNTATEAYRAATSTGLDSDGYAAAQLKLVEIRPYAIHIRSVLAKPHRPDGSPWVGPPNPALTMVLKSMAAFTANAFIPGTGAFAAGVVNASARVPPENRPTLHVRAVLPDQRRLVTPSKTSIYAAYDSMFVVNTNSFDTHRISFTVRHTGSGEPDDVGTIDVPLKDLVRQPDTILADQSIAALQIVTTPAEEMVDGMFSEMTPLRDETNDAGDFSRPNVRSNGYKLVGVEARAILGDYQDEFGMDGAPDLVVTIEQGGKTVYRSKKMQDSNQATWKPSSTFLWVEPSDQLIVRVIDIDAADNDQVLAAYVDVRALVAGHFEMRTPLGSTVRLRFEPRRVLMPLNARRF